MSLRLPIALCVYLTSKGHYGSQTLYRATLEDLDRQIPLRSFAARVAHLKVQPGEEAAAAGIGTDLKSMGFNVYVATAGWSRGQSHMAEYLKDQIRVSRLPELNDCQFVWHCDDDSALVSHRDTLEVVLARMTSLISASPDTLTARFLRREDLPATLAIQSAPAEGDVLWTSDVNFQQPLLRSLDYYRMLKIVEDNWATASQMHIEALWREVLGHFARGQRRHAVWHPDCAETVHLGVPDYAAVCARHSLTVRPNFT